MLAMSFYNFFQPTAQPLTLGKHQGRRSLCANQDHSYPFSMGIRSTSYRDELIDSSDPRSEVTSDNEDHNFYYEHP
jgi:hypothetical protein